MTIRDRQPWLRRGVLTTALLAAGFLALRWLPLAAGPRETSNVRQLVLVVRDMTFYVEGDSTPNPTLRFTPGEQVRLFLRNEQSGVTHNFVISEWDVRSRELRGRGSDRIEFRVPLERGARRYQCMPHAAMMTGIIDVR